MRKGFGLLYLLLFTMSLHASDSFIINHTFNSKYPEQERQITIHLPASYYQQDSYQYPVMILLDGQSNMDYAQTVSAFLAENGLIPEMIVVGLHAGATRERDYLPRIGDGEGSMSGDAGQFMQYISQELIPYIEDNYRAAPLRLVSGHSVGGIFSIYAMLQQPGLFQGYLAQSPYLQPPVQPMLNEGIQAFDEDNAELNKYFYMNLGDEPDLANAFEQVQTELEANLPQNFRMAAERSPGETHMTTRLVGHYQGLKGFFADHWPLSQQQIVASGGEGVKAHVEALSKRYGYPVRYSEQPLIQAVQIFLSQKQAEPGLTVARLYTEQYPSSPLAHFLLANGLILSGDQASAVSAVDKAISLYEQEPDPKLEQLYPVMKNLKQQLTAE